MSPPWAIGFTAALLVLTIGAALAVFALVGWPLGERRDRRRQVARARPARLIGAPATFLATVIACAGLGAGIYATLATENGVGAAAAYAVGLFAAIVAMTGQVPRIKIGDNELNLAYTAGEAAAATDMAEKVGDASELTDDPQELVEVVEEAAAGYWRQLRTAARDAGGSLKPVTRSTADLSALTDALQFLADQGEHGTPGQRAREYERKVASRIELLLPKVAQGLSVTVEDHTKRGPRRVDGIADFEVRVGSKTGYIEAMWGATSFLSTLRINKFWARLTGSKRTYTDETPPGLAVSNAALKPATEPPGDGPTRLIVVTWFDERDDADLESALASFLQLLVDDQGRLSAPAHPEGPD